MDTTIHATMLAAACAAFAAFCSPVMPDASDVPTGIWDGNHIVADVPTAGAAVELDCAHGTVSVPLVTDANFELTGTFTPERGGPTRDGDPDRTQPARYTGHVNKSTLTLTIVLTNSNESIGVFTLTHGATPRLTKCK